MAIFGLKSQDVIADKKIIVLQVISRYFYCMNALILSAGLGTRLKPFTDSHPKALAPVNGKPVLQRNIEYLQQYGITNVMVNVHHYADQIIHAIKSNSGWGSNVLISDETNAVLETGGGIKKAGWFLEQTENCVVVNADILTDLKLNEMIDEHRMNMSLATLATSSRVSSRCLLFNYINQLCGWRNIKTGEEKIPVPIENTLTLTPKSFSGLQILNNRIFRLMRMTGKFSIIDAYLDLCSDQRISSYDHSHTKFMDIGTTEKLQQAAEMFA